MKKKTIYISILIAVLVAVIVFQSCESNKAAAVLDSIEKQNQELNRESQKSRKEYEKKLKESEKATEDLRVKIVNSEAKLKESESNRLSLKKKLKSRGEMKEAPRAELLREIEKYHFTLAAAEESIFHLTHQNKLLRAENKQLRYSLKLSKQEVARLLEENQQKDIYINAAVSAGRKVRTSFAGKLILFTAGVVTASLVR